MDQSDEVDDCRASRPLRQDEVLGRYQTRRRRISCEHHLRIDLEHDPVAAVQSMNSAPCATIIISTKNRSDDLRKTVESSLQQSANPEVLVLDDGSTDGTSDVIRNEFPQ